MYKNINNYNNQVIKVYKKNKYYQINMNKKEYNYQINFHYFI